MSFGPNNTTKTAENNLGGVSSALQNDAFPKLFGAGTDAFNTGSKLISPATGFLSTLLSGNGANTTAALAPDIHRIQDQHANALRAINTISPRGGGRYGALFGESLAPASQIGGLFDSARTSAAQLLPAIGTQEQGIGTSLFGQGVGALNGAGSVNSSLAQLGQQDKRTAMSGWSSLGSGLFGLATTPFGGGTASNGLLGLIK